MGNYLFLGGLAGMAGSLLLTLILLPVFRWQRKRKLEKIERGEE